MPSPLKAFGSIELMEFFDKYLLNLNFNHHLFDFPGIVSRMQKLFKSEFSVDFNYCVGSPLLERSLMTNAYSFTHEFTATTTNLFLLGVDS